MQLKTFFQSATLATAIALAGCSKSSNDNAQGTTMTHVQYGNKFYRVTSDDASQAITAIKEVSRAETEKPVKMPGGFESVLGLNTVEVNSEEGRKIAAALGRAPAAPAPK